MAEIKIGFDAKRFFHNGSGLGNYSRDLVRILAENYPELSLNLFAEKKSDRGEALLQLKNIHFYPIKGVFSRQMTMGKSAEQAGMQIFHGLSGELPWRWGESKIKKVVTIHDLIFERYPQYYSFADRHIHHWKFQKAVEEADEIVAISEQTKRDILKFLKVDSAKIRVIYQGCHSAFKMKFSGEEKESLREKLDLPQDFILSVGTLEPRKQQLALVEALAGTDIPLVLVGKKNAPYFSKIEKAAKMGKVELLYREVREMEALSCLYQMARFSVYISEFEGFGIPVIESLFAGCPVICSNRSSIPEAGGEIALYVDPNNLDDIRAKVKFLWKNPAEGERRMKNTKPHLEKFCDEPIAGEWLWLYRGLLS